MNLKEISEIDYNSSNLPILFEDKQTDRMFAIISNNIHSFKFGWQSTIIKPVVKEIGEEIYAIGIDQNFIIINLSTGDIKLKLDLFYTFSNIEVYNDFIFVMTELEVFIINKINFTRLTEVFLPEFYANMEVNGTNIKFICIDDSEVDFDLNKL